MGAIWPIALSNATLVAAGTPLVWAVGRFAHRPALTHALAVILLLKLITPPLWRIPIAPPEPKVASKQIEAPIRHSAPSPVESNWMADHAADRVILSDPRSSTDEPIDQAPAARAADQPAAVAPTSEPEPNRPPEPPRWREWIIPLTQWIWIGGTMVCAFIAVARVVRFSRALRYATRARHVQPRANLLARRLGLRGAPSVWFVPGFVSPMLWSLGGARLLLPQALWDRLNLIERDTILLHELAHWRRGDPAIRWIELAATCLYWWHPACWWARRELREAEEQCCDAWVLWALPGTFKNYANALLEAVEFVSVGADRPSARSAVPALASRMGQFVHLRRRLTMLKHGNIARALSWGGLAGVMTLGSFVLPVAPTWGQDRPAPEPEPEPRQVAPDVQPDPFAAPAAEPGSQRIQTTPDVRADQDQEDVDLQRKLAELDRAKADLQRKAAELDRAKAEAALARKMDALKRARADAERAAQDQKSPTLPKLEGMVNPPDPAEEELGLHIKQLQAAHAMAELKQAEQTIQQLKKQLVEAQVRIAELERRAAGGGFGSVFRTTPPVAPPAPRMAPPAPEAPPAANTPNGKWEYRFAPGEPGPQNVVPEGGALKPVPIEPDRKDPGARLEYAPGVKDGQYRVIIKDPTTGRIKEIQTHVVPRAGGSRTAADASQAERLDKIEAQLQTLMKEIERMRQAGATTPTPTPDRPDEARP